MGASSATALAALKIGGRVAFERLVRPKARGREDVPCSPAAITPEWLTAVLCRSIRGPWSRRSRSSRPALERTSGTG